MHRGGVLMSMMSVYVAGTCKWILARDANPNYFIKFSVATSTLNHNSNGRIGRMCLDVVLLEHVSTSEDKLSLKPWVLQVKLWHLQWLAGMVLSQSWNCGIHKRLNWWLKNGCPHRFPDLSFLLLCSYLIIIYYCISTSNTLWQSRTGMQISYAAMKHFSETVCCFLKLVPGLLPSHLGSKWACVATRGSSLAAGWEKPLWGKAKETEVQRG